MDEAMLARRLAALAPADIDDARARAESAVPAAVEAASRTRGRTLGARPRARAVGFLAALSIAVVATALFTPPGQALTSWVGARLGFGEPGGPPTLRQLRASWTKGTAAEGQPAHVLVRGPAPRGDRYEFITFEPQSPPGKPWNLRGPCFELDITKARSSFGAGCGVLPPGRDLGFVNTGGNAQPGAELLSVSGRTSYRVDSVQVEYGGRKIPVELSPAPSELLDRFGIPEPFKFFISFVPAVGHGGQLSVTARDSTGHVLARIRRKTIGGSPRLSAGP